MGQLGCAKLNLNFEGKNLLLPNNYTWNDEHTG